MPERAEHVIIGGTLVRHDSVEALSFSRYLIGYFSRSCVGDGMAGG